MQKRIPTIIALTALVVAMFGSTPLGNAAGRLILANNSVGTPQLKKNAVTTAKVKNGTLTAADFRGGVLPAGPKGDTGAAGAPGPKGDKGDKGDTGAAGQPGLSGYQVVVGNGQTLAPGATGYSDALCPAGKKVIAGGFNGSNGVVIDQSMPDASSTVWSAHGHNTAAVQGYVQALAVCAAVS
jgi:hypothetical protein